MLFSRQHMQLEGNTECDIMRLQRGVMAKRHHVIQRANICDHRRVPLAVAWDTIQLGLCVHASIMNALVAGLVYRAWPMDLWIGFGACLGGMGMSMSCAMTSILVLP